MKKSAFVIISLLFTASVSLSAQAYDNLWKEFKAAADDDLPQTEIAVLEKIASKAENSKDYGHLLKAEMKRAEVYAALSGDSLNSEMARLDRRAETAADSVVRAIYNCVLAKAGTAVKSMSHRNSVVITMKYSTDEYRRRALSNPAMLAAAKAGAYAPFVVEGVDSGIFGGDMLSVIANEVRAYDVMEAYYTQSGNRPAACISAALRVENTPKSNYAGDVNDDATIVAYDSLINLYGDLKEAGEVAILKYQRIQWWPNVSAKDKMAFLDDAISRWSGWKRTDVLKNFRDELTRPDVSINIPYIGVRPTDSLKVFMNRVRNLKSVSMAMYKVDTDGLVNLDPNNEDDYKKLKKLCTAISERSIKRTYSGHQPYEELKDSIVIAPLAAGIYMLELGVQPQNDVKRTLLYVSNVGLLAEEIPNNRVRMVVVDATTGHPLKGAKIDVAVKKEYSKPVVWSTLVCDKKGEAVFDKGVYDIERVFPYIGSDRFVQATDVFTYFDMQRERQKALVTKVFTDRSIYRPGQTVRMTSVLYLNGEKGSVVVGKKIRAVLYDANNKPVAEKELTTDAFGGVSADFTLPRNTLSGRFSISVNGNSRAYFRVEEYKRPTFRVVMPELKTAYSAGDTLRLKGKAEAYSGVAVQGATVRYTVDRVLPLWWRYFGMNSDGPEDEQLLHGTVTTAADGTFDIEVPLTLPETVNRHSYFYNFTVRADVTDVAGETQNGEMNVPLGSKKGWLTADIPEKVLADSLHGVNFSLINAAGKNVDATVKFRFDNAGKWQSATTTAPFEIKKKLSSGLHTLEAICEGDTMKKEFVVFSLKDKRPCVESGEWFYTSAGQFPADGGEVTVQMGSSLKDIHAVYTVIAGDSLLESGTFCLKNSIETRRFQYKKLYGNGILITCAWMRDGELHRYSTTIKKPQPDRKLRVGWKTFRDRLTPGQSEEWTLSVSNPDGTPAEARLMATLYDKSLDALSPHSWSLNTYVFIPTPAAEWATLGKERFYGYVPMKLQPRDVKSLDFGRFVVDLSNAVYNPVLRPMLLKEVRVGSQRAESHSFYRLANDNTVAGSNIMMKGYASDDAIEAKEEEGKASGAAGQFRENFNEAAFFAPSIVTDSAGHAVMKFTLPESVTTWRFMGLAHTKDMRVGSLTAEAVAKKDIMVMPNIPRFVRVGDKAVITTRIANTADRDVSGVATIKLIDPETAAIVHTEMVEFRVAKGQTTTAKFPFTPDGGQSLLICRITAEGQGYSDGEQHYLPILPNREMVTKTVPITLHSKGVKTIDIASLFPEGTDNRKLTVEYTEHPEWMVIQTFPTIAVPSDDNAIELTASLYANSMADHLIGRQPKLKALMEQWKRESGTETSLESSLSKNQSLKDIILAETPWVAEADMESEQKRRLADFFDRSMIDQRLDNATAKLAKLQNSDGSWSWWQGMKGSTYMTVAVAEMLARQTIATGNGDRTEAMLGRAYAYLDRQQVETVEQMKADKKKGIKPSFPGMTTLKILYINAITGRELSAGVKSATDFLLPLLEKDNRKQTIYAKAMAAIVLNKNGRVKKAQTFVRSLKEYSLFTEEMGRYYDTPKAQQSWYSYKIPSHVMAMEAISAITPDDFRTIEEMQRWLLQEKRTQTWENAINNVNAAWALLDGGSMEKSETGSKKPKSGFDASELGEAIFGNGPRSEITIDGRPLEMSETTAGLGYVKTAINNPEGKTLAISKTSGGTSWGAVYARFMQESVAAETQGSGISITKEIIRKDSEGETSSNGASSPSEAGSSPSAKLKVGDKVTVRITIKAGRDMDFVQISDRRAACLEPVRQLSGYRGGYYYSPKDNATNYFFDRLPKGTHVVETEYYVDRSGTYTTGTCTAGCAYAPEFRTTAAGQTIVVKP